MKSVCLPFRQIPHSSRLFTDFLSWSSPVRQFYPRSPYFQEWMADETSRVRYDSARRELVSSVLERQNKEWNASPKTLENIERFRGGAAAIVTGQQVGLFGGPLFAIFKALSVIKLASQASEAGIDAVPIFWLASTDHDLAEVNRVLIPGQDGLLQTLNVPTSGVQDAPVGAVTFSSEIDSVLDAATRLLGQSEIEELLRDAYHSGENFGTAFARLFAQIFADWGVILIDASDADLHRISEPIYSAAIERGSELNEALLARGRTLEAEDYHQQVKVTPSSTLLFMLVNGARSAVHRRPSGESQEFVIGEEKLSTAEMLSRIHSSPAQFSPNVLLRPVVQDYLLPTLAYVGGAAETAYFAQAGVIYERLLGRTTPVLPRFSATLVEPKIKSLLDRYHLGLPDVFHGTDSLRELLGKNVLPQQLQTAFERADATLQQSLGEIQRLLAQLDKTLIDAATNAGSKIHHQLDQLRSRAARAELRQTEVLTRHARILSEALYPNKMLQEREHAGVYFLARYGTDLLRDLYEVIHTVCLDHQIISLNEARQG